MKNFKRCHILKTAISVTNMEDVSEYIVNSIETLRGKYICVANVHTTVMSYENSEYRLIQNSSALTLPDGKPLSIVSRTRGFANAQRVTGPDLMQKLFEISNKSNSDNTGNIKHYFFGSTEKTLNELRKNLSQQYPNIAVAGMVSPPFRALTEQEDITIINGINQSGADVIWVGLGAPKQEQWMYNHRDKVNGVMIGVGAGFDFHAGTVKRAPKWIQTLCLEWFYRLLQDPKRLWKRYVKTNFKFIRLIVRENRELIRKNK